MIITKDRTELLTIELLNALLANVATGLMTLDELWAQIDPEPEPEPEPESNIVREISYYRHKIINTMDLSDFPKNRICGFDTGAGI